MALAFLKVDTSSRNIGLDVLRAVAILLVLLSHGRQILPPNGWVNYFGFFGVELFFVLSGFLIGKILIKTFISFASEVKPIHLLDFWIRRWFRTLPNYYLFVFLNVVIGALVLKQQTFSFTYLLFVQNLYSGNLPFMPESWSLSVEEWFYLSFPLWLFLFVRSLQFNLSKKILWGILSYIGLFTALRVLAVLFGGIGWPAIRFIVLCRLDAIGFGILAAFFDVFYPLQFKKYKKVLLGLGFCCLLFTVYLSSQNFTSPDNSGYYFKMFFFTQTSIGFALILPFLMGIDIKNRIIRDAFSHLSIISYSLYLIHYSVVLKLILLIKGKYGVHWVPSYFSYWILSIVLATMCYRFFEKPTTDLRLRFLQKNRPSEALVVA